MRCKAALLALTIFLAPAAMRLAVAAQDTAAIRCAIACGHAMGAVKGAACCPMSDAPDSGPALKACSRGGDAAIAPMAPAPILAAFHTRLEPPVGSRRFQAAEDAALRPPFLRAPDKVPLLFG